MFGRSHSRSGGGGGGIGGGGASSGSSLVSSNPFGLIPTIFIKNDLNTNPNHILQKK